MLVEHKYSQFTIYPRQNKFYLKFRIKKYNLLNKLTKNMSVLEIGSNNGNLCKMLYKKTKEYTCIEPNHKLAIHYKNLNVIFCNKFFDEDIITKLNNKYDFILCLAVLNHTKLSYNKIIDILHGLLNKNGVVLIESTKTGNIEKKILEKIENNECNKFKLITESKKYKEINNTKRIYYYIKKIN